jgi:hypothetical protein
MSGFPYRRVCGCLDSYGRVCGCLDSSDEFVDVWIPGFPDEFVDVWIPTDEFVDVWIPAEIDKEDSTARSGADSVDRHNLFAASWF